MQAASRTVVALLLSTIMSVTDETLPQQPDVQEGIEYWNNQPANYDGVLGGFGTGSLPRVDALGSRRFLQYMMPELCTVPSAVRPLEPRAIDRRIRAVDVGAGVGRVTSDVLLHLVHDVVLVEPVESFIGEAFRRGSASASENPLPDGQPTRWKGIKEKTKSVTFIRGTLQTFDPSNPGKGTHIVGRVGYVSPEDDLDSKFDVIWCQWCLGHLNDQDLGAFFRRCRKALRDPENSIIMVKENLCTDMEDGGPKTIFDESDSSLTRSDMAWKKAFTDAGLELLDERLQRGFPEGLYDVKMYALR
ncbi:unnamed protein product [Somion occarium]|uniref:Alpha N-terminal protein methyltransferase 1 n=1 Tax=Somion occarium TaxID=3059160 RepID=A0ABP1DA23_9APHY